MKINFFLYNNLSFRLRVNAVYRDYLTESVERDYILEKKAAVKEYEDKKIDLKENLLADMEEKRKMIELDRHTVELTGDSMEVKVIKFTIFYFLLLRLKLNVFGCFKNKINYYKLINFIFLFVIYFRLNHQ